MWVRLKAAVLAGVEVRPLDEQLGRAAVRLLGSTGLSDVIEAAVVPLASDGDEIRTTDLDNIAAHLEASGRHVELVHP